MATKYSAFGTLFKRGAATIAQVSNISGPGLSLDTQDVTSHDSTGAWEEVVPTILRSGEVKLDLVYDPNEATHKYAAGGLLSDMVLRTATAYSLVFPSVAPVTWTFNAFVTGFEPSAPHDGALTASATLKITGQPTVLA
jgi:predicted secreted protein